MGERIAVVSDIHSNLPALEAVFDDIDSQHVDKIICLGDLVGYGPFPQEVLALRSRFHHVIMGNHDSDLVREDYSRFRKEDTKRTLILNRQELSEEEIAFLAGLSNEPYRERRIGLAGVHGVFSDERHEIIYVMKENAYFKELDWLVTNDIRIGVAGHTHLPVLALINQGYGYQYKDQIFPQSFRGKRYSKKVAFTFGPKGPKAIYANGGSVGQPRNELPAAQYLILDFKGDTLTLDYRAVRYDIDKTVAEMKKKRYPEMHWDRLYKGR